MSIRTLGFIAGAFLAGISSGRAGTIERTWSDGPIPVRQVIADSGVRFCDFITINEDQSRLELSKHLDGTTELHFSLGGTATWNTGGAVTILIDGQGFSLNMVLSGPGWLRADDLSDEFRHAIYNGYSMTVRTGDTERTFSLAGTATAITVLNRCGEAIIAQTAPPPQSAYAPPPATQPTYAPPTRAEAALIVEGGTFHVSGTINGTTTLDFTLDSGSADVAIPQSIAAQLLAQGSLQFDDLRGLRTYVLADGRSIQKQTGILRSVTVGGQTLTDVPFTINTGGALLGQSFLGRLSSWSIDNARSVLVMQ
jgi:predicted aspartyl protease